jgi:hypothetical protein
MVTGKVPFEAETPLAVILQHMQDPLPLPSKVKPGVSPGIEAVILKALAKNPEDRFGTATEFLEAWKAAMAGSPTVAAKPGTARAPLPTVSARPATATVLAGTAPVAPAPSAAAPAPRRGVSWPLIVGGIAVVLCLGAIVLVALGGFALGQFRPGAPAPQATAAAGAPPPAAPASAESGGSQATPVPASSGASASGASQATPEPAGPVTVSPDMNLPAGDQFTIGLGQTVSNGKPGPGAGNVEKDGAHDIYLFSAKPGQMVYIQVTPEPKLSGNVTWRLIDSSGSKLFDTCLACTEPGVQTLDAGGTYALVVGNDAGSPPATGTYGFKVLAVPPPQQFTINVGDEVSGSKPGPGAGNIQSPGAKEVYTFTAQAGQTVYFQVTQPNKEGSLRWQLLDDAGTKIFDTCLQCTEPGNQLLDKGGVYSIVVGNDNGAATGTYGFKLWDVPPPQQFALNIGDEVSNGKPGPGAGNIESPGVKDIYTFTAQAGQTVYFQVTQPNKSGSLKVQLLDDAGNALFDTCLQCTEPGDQTLDKGGVYTVIVGNDTGVALGPYSFRTYAVPPPQTFAINIGDQVSKDKPGPGAGNIEAPGVKDIYTFTAQAGQKVTVHITEAPKGNGNIRIMLLDDANNKVFETCLQCSDPAPQTLDKGGQYRLVVGNDSGAGVGAYGFQLQSAP